jgi:hypothetical protein
VKRASNWVPGLGGAAVRRNPAAPVAGSARKEVREVCEITLGQFAVGVETEGQPAAVLRDAVRCQPRERLPRRGVGTTAVG